MIKLRYLYPIYDVINVRKILFTDNSEGLMYNKKPKFTEYH